MRLFLRILIVLGVVGAAAAAADQQPPPSPLPAAAATTYKAYVAAIVKDYQVETDKVKAALKKEQEATTKKGDLDGALAIKDLLTRIEGGGALADIGDDLKSNLLGESKPAPPAAPAQGWAEIRVETTPPDAGAIDDAKVGTIVVLRTHYTYAQMDLPASRGGGCKVLQVVQGYNAATYISVTSGGRLYFVSGLSLPELLAILPKEIRPEAALGVRGPGVVSVATGVAPTGFKFYLQGYESRVIAGNITMWSGAVAPRTQPLTPAPPAQYPNPQYPPQQGKGVGYGH